MHINTHIYQVKLNTTSKFAAGSLKKITLKKISKKEVKENGRKKGTTKITRHNLPLLYHKYYSAKANEIRPSLSRILFHVYARWQQDKGPRLALCSTSCQAEG